MKVGIVGCGFVGSSGAYAMALKGTVSEIVLVDLNKKLAQGQAEDILHATPFSHPVRVMAGDYPVLADAGVVILACGVGQRPGETRLQLLERNAEVFKKVIPQVLQYAPEALLLVVSNPVDVITQVVTKLSGINPAKVIGSGTILDTARFRALLAEHFGVDPRSVHAYIAGEHGDSEVPVWSLANIAGMPLADFATANGIGHDPARLEEIFEATRDAAYHIIERKGATYYAVAAGLVRICEAILRDQATVLSVSSLICDYYGIDDVYLSVPSVIGRAGVEKTLRLALSAEEASGLRHSADLLKATLMTLESATSS